MVRKTLITLFFWLSFASHADAQRLRSSLHGIDLWTVTVVFGLLWLAVMSDRRRRESSLDD